MVAGSYIPTLDLLVGWSKRQPCAACAAKDQTIVLLSDVVDWHRAQVGISLQSATEIVRPTFKPGQSPEKMWLDDDEEELIAQVEAGAISQEDFEKGLAGLQAQNATLTVVK